ncbi:N-6 DNA methylase (plasmid) [Acinetobacter defluvii]|uniref:N-6 DNA methylase n=1 Tax=Acinetobacter defluvii TaxID=1871111 RepID=A0A2S2F881_9GAMM|nr:SNF2-related protein [Acinetobacter defluvii]AWL27157.1 N-6 DNA methylase [Acinetobacter defluvii]
MPKNNPSVLSALDTFIEASRKMKEQLNPLPNPKGRYGFKETKVTPSVRQKANNKAVETMRLIDGTGERATEEQKEILSKYTGKGGNLEVEGVKGSQYEYFTPKPLADQMWVMLKEMGFDGGLVLDPSAGTGIFAAGRPENVVMQSVELSEVSGKINALVNDESNHHVIVSPFEKVAAQTEDNTYDAIITNVPFGSNADRGANPQYDIYDKDPLDSYFVKRSIDKLKHGKLAIFIAHTKLMTGASFRKFRHQISLKAELVGAYRLPTSIFHSTGADVVTDLLVYRKHSEEMTDKIQQLYENGGLETLAEARVLDKNIIDGKYFKTEGKKFVLGEITKLANFRNKAQEIETVVNNDSLSNILKLIKRFPDSRIDFEALNLAEVPQALPVQEGDVRVMAGTTFEYQNGKWIPSKTIARFNHESDFENPLAAYNARMTHNHLTQMIGYCQSSGKTLPEWVQKLSNVVSQPKQHANFNAWLVILAVKHVLDTVGRVDNYAAAFPELTSGMVTHAVLVNQNQIKHALFKTELRQAKIAFDGNGINGLSDHWYGKSINLNIQLNAKEAYENAIYRGQADNWMVDIAEIRKSDPNFNPLTNDDYAINADGTKVSLNRDYYTGNHGDFLARIDEQIKNATDPEVKGKLIKQRQKSFEFTNNVDVTKLNLGLRATNVDFQTKADFLGAYGGADVVTDLDGKITLAQKAESLDFVLRRYKYDGADKARKDQRVQAYFLNRILDSLNNGSNFHIKAKKDSLTQAQFDFIYAELLEYAKEMDSTFNAYLQSNVGFMDLLNQKINDPKHKEMTTELDDSPLEITGFNPKLDTFKGMNTYQNEEVRRLSRRFEGITAFDVGLGKTMTSIAVTQAMHNIGVKKRTMFVVPSHTISKWYKDMKMCLDNVDDVLVIGSDENRLDGIKSGNYPKDLNLLLSKPYRKIIITSDAFTMIPLKDQTIMDFYGFKLDGLEKDKDIEKANAFIAKKEGILQKNKGQYPFFEDLSIDSIVFDEAQMFKNGDSAEGDSNFQRISGLSLLAESQLSSRAISAKVKSWYVRGQNELNDGVVLLTATPITNSPAEIITMLSLAVGDDKARRMLGGAAINSVDDFLSTFAHTELLQSKDITGYLKNEETFTGFKNVELLKNALHTIANVQTAKERGLKIPDQEDVKTQIDLPESEKNVLDMMKDAYMTARQVTKGGGLGVSEDAMENLDKISEMLGEPIDLIASPFNLISKMSDIILMGEDIAVTRSFVVDIDANSIPLAGKVADLFNKKTIKVETERTFPLVQPEDMRVKRMAKDFGDNTLYEVTARCFVDEDKNQLRLTVNDSKAIATLLEIADKEKLSVKPKLSAKVQSFLENFKLELANPLYNGHSKQLVFCDTVSMHHIIKKALVVYCGVPAAKIAILNAQTKPDGKVGKPSTDDVQTIQDEFAESNFTVVIANKKADTGIDLQKGTQAIHHLTTGWTPDSLQQRNGRGIRQGNTQKSVRVYFYNANGTFDEYKVQVVSGKANWIDHLMDKKEDTEGTVKVSQALSDDEYDLMIQADSPEKVTELLKEREIREQKNRRDRAIKQSTLLGNIAKKAAENAGQTKEQVISDQIKADYRKYALLMMEDDKAKTSEERAEILKRKQDLIKPYDGVLSNNIVINWDKSFAWKVQQKSIDYMSVESLSGSYFGSADQVRTMPQRIIDSENGELYQRFKDSHESIQRMAETSLKQYLDYADSPFTQIEKQALFDGTAVLLEDGTVRKSGDICQATVGGKLLYGVFRVDDGVEISPRLSTTSWVTPKDIAPIAPQDRQKAIDDFVEFEKAEMSSRNVYSYESLSERDATDIRRFSSIFPEVEAAVTKALTKEQAQWIDQDTTVRLRSIKIKSGLYYWHESIFNELHVDNPDLVKTYNSKFDGLIKDVVLDDDRVPCLVIPNVKLNDFVRDSLKNDVFMLDEIFYIAQKHNHKIKFRDPSSSKAAHEYFLENQSQVNTKIIEQINNNDGSRLYPFDTVLSDEQKTDIAKLIAVNSLLEAENSEVFLNSVMNTHTFKELLKKYAVDASSPEGIVKKYTKLHTGLGRFKNQKITGVAFIGNGSFGNAFRTDYKDRMKTYATSQRKSYVWDGKNTRWIVEPEVMLWMMQQDWFKLDAVDFFEE